jgi:hypothetical protein
LLLTKSNDKEIILSSLNFIRTLCVIFNDATLAQYLPELLNGLIYLKDSSNKKFATQRIRGEIKVVLKKLIKKFSYEIILEKLASLIDPARTSVKQDFTKMMSNIKKALEHEKKLKANKGDGEKKKGGDVDLISMYSKATSAAKVQNNEIEHLLEDSDSDDDNDDEEDKYSRKTNKSGKDKKDKGAKIKANTWIKEDDENDEPLNLLDPMAIKNVLATRPLTQEQIQKKKDKEMNNKAKNRGFKVNQDGRLIIKDDDNDNDDGVESGADSDEEIIDNKSRNIKKKEKIRKSASANLDELMDTLSLSKMSAKKNKEKKDDDNDDNNDAFSYKTGGSGIHRNLNKPKRKEISFGEEYRAKVILFLHFINFF